jgi:hypothetical protein
MTFTSKDVLAAMEAAVKEAGEDYHYTDPEAIGMKMCHYEPDQEHPYGCIVGATLARLDMALLEAVWGSESSIEANVDNLPSIEYDAVAALQKPQEMQDQGSSWGEALDAYRAWVIGD